MQTLTRWIVRATLPVTLLFAACDSEEPVDGRSADVEEASLKADAQERGHHGPPWEKICALASCTDAQVDQVAALFRAHRPDRHGARPDPDAHKDLNLALAAKVRAGGLTAADLAAHRQAIRAGKPAKHGDMAELLVGLHKILTPTQRGALADAFLAGHGGALARLGGGHHGDFGGWDHGDEGHRGDRHRGDRHAKGEGKGKGHGKLKGVGKLCKIAECSDEQRASLEAIVQRSREAGEAQRAQAKATREAANKALADAFRSDAFDEAAVDRFHATLEPLHAAKAQAMDQLVVDALAVLDAGQRAKIASVIEEKGVRALMPGKGKHGKHGKKGRKGHGHRGEGRDREASDDVPA